MVLSLGEPRIVEYKDSCEREACDGDDCVDEDVPGERE